MPNTAAVEARTKRGPRITRSTATVPFAKKTVLSKDGTAIAFDRIGNGAPVILVDAALCYRAMGQSQRDANCASTTQSHLTGNCSGTASTSPEQVAGPPYARGDRLVAHYPLLRSVDGEVEANRADSGTQVCFATLTFPSWNLITRWFSFVDGRITLGGQGLTHCDTSDTVVF
jgi:hypothetical protein